MTPCAPSSVVPRMPAKNMVTSNAHHSKHSMRMPNKPSFTKDPHSVRLSSDSPESIGGSRVLLCRMNPTCYNHKLQLVTETLIQPFCKIFHSLQQINCEALPLSHNLNHKEMFFQQLKWNYNWKTCCINVICKLFMFLNKLSIWMMVCHRCKKINEP